MKRKETRFGLKPSETQFLMGGLDLMLENGRQKFWSREIVQWMDDHRCDGRFTSAGTVAKASIALEHRELITVDRVSKTHRRNYFSLTPEGVALAPLIFLEETAQTVNTIGELAGSLKCTAIGRLAIASLYQAERINLEP